jgi:hypothetical protein
MKARRSPAWRTIGDWEKGETETKNWEYPDHLAPQRERADHDLEGVAAGHKH